MTDIRYNFLKNLLISFNLYYEYVKSRCFNLKTVSIIFMRYLKKVLGLQLQKLLAVQKFLE